jgi:hypothetical protein
MACLATRRPAISLSNGAALTLPLLMIPTRAEARLFGPAGGLKRVLPCGPTGDTTFIPVIS